MSDGQNKIYAAIDLKSFYASVECAERGLDPMVTNLVVADSSRTEKTICLAVSPSLKAYGIPGRPRLFEVVQKVSEVNALRKSRAPGRRLTGSSSCDPEVKANPSLALDYIVAPPQMAKYIKRSTEIYNVYLKYIAPGDIHVYSIDEVFLDLTEYLYTYHCTARELVMTMIHDVLSTTGITATAGLGTNLYLAKIAMDIVAKHASPDRDGVRIAELDEQSYRRELWEHRPLTDFWRVGHGYAKKLESLGLYTMGDIAMCSVHNEDALYRMFGVNAELLIDHAWGWEPCTMPDIKQYRPESSSIGSGQVLQSPYTFDKARLVVREMAQLLALQLLRRRLVTDQAVLTIGYDIECLSTPSIREAYSGDISCDRYGRAAPKSAHGSANLAATSSEKKIVSAVDALFCRISDPLLLVRRVYLTANHVTSEEQSGCQPKYEQLDLFLDETEQSRLREEAELERERRMQLAMLKIQDKYGKNAILKGTNLQEGATTVQRNRQIGGHKA